MSKVQQLLIRFGEKLGTQIRGLPLIWRKIIFIPVTPVQHGREREREIEHLLHACVTSLLTKMQNKLGYDIDDGIYIRGSNFQSVPSHMLNFLKTTCQNSKSKPGTWNVVFSFRFFSQFSLPGGSEPFPLTFYQYYFFMLLLNLLQKCCFLFTSTTFFFFLVLNLLEKMLFPFLTVLLFFWSLLNFLDNCWSNFKITLFIILFSQLFRLDYY